MEIINESKLRKGLNYLKIDGIFSQSMGTLISGTFIVPLLLLFGANSFHVGLLSTIAALASISQLLSLNIMNKVNGRKKVCVMFSLLARLTLLFLSIGLILNLVSNLAIILLFFMVFYSLTNISNAAFNYWMLDFVPREIRGRYFASRTRISLLIGNIIGLITIIYIDFVASGNRVAAYGDIILLASILGLIGVYFLANIPEPKFNGSDPLSIRTMREFLKIESLKRHFEAIFFLYLAINLSTPFFVYYMLTRLELGLSLIFIVTMTSQFFTILLLPKWGSLIDKYGVKPVLRFSAYITIITILLWPFTTLPERYVFSVPLVFIIYILMGGAIGGLNLSSNLIAYYLAKDRKATYGISLNNISISLGTIVGSFLGALISIPASYMELSMTFHIFYSEKITIFIIDFKGLDFVFAASTILGMFALSLLRRYKIEAESDEDRNYVEIVIGVKRFIRSSVNHIPIIIYRKMRDLNHRNIRRCLSFRRGVQKAVVRN